MVLLLKSTIESSEQLASHRDSVSILIKIILHGFISLSSDSPVFEQILAKLVI